MGTPHPLYLGLVNSSPLPAAALGDLLVSSLNNNGGAFHQSPPMTTCEEEIVRSFARLFGVTGADGMLVPGGMFAMLQALVLARVHATGGPARPGFRLYASDVAHFTVSRSAMVAGLASEDVIAIPSSGRGVMDVQALAQRIRRDRAEGATPFAVVATAGTTATGAMDPIASIAAVCKEERLWLHVDACYGGAAMLLESMRQRFSGVELADSIAIDPHKWFFIPVTAALVLTTHGDVARRVFATTTGSYIPTEGEVDAWQRGVPSTRRSSGLTVWMALRAHGWRTIRTAVQSNIDLTRELEILLGQRGFRVLDGGELSIACARWEPAGRTPEALDRLQDQIARERSGVGDRMVLDDTPRRPHLAAVQHGQPLHARAPCPPTGRRPRSDGQASDHHPVKGDCDGTDGRLAPLGGPYAHRDVWSRMQSGWLHRWAGR